MYRDVTSAVTKNVSGERGGSLSVMLRKYFVSYV